MTPRQHLRKLLGRNPNAPRKPVRRMFSDLAKYFVSSAELALVLWMPGYARSVRKRMSRLPDVIVIGAQKAATTWLHQQVSTNDRLATSEIKECHHFDLGRMWTLSRYARQFDHARPDQTVIEFAPDYGPLATWRIRAISKIAPGLRMLHIARNPVERAWSAAKMETAFVNNLDLNAVSAIDLVAYLGSSRCRGHSDYLHVLGAWSSVFGHQNLRVMLYDDLRADPTAFLRDVLSFVLDRSTLTHKELSAAGRAKVFSGVDDPPAEAAALFLRREYVPLCDAFLDGAQKYLSSDALERARRAWPSSTRAILADPRREHLLFVAGFSPSKEATSAGQKLAYRKLEELRITGDFAQIDVVAFVNERDALDPPPVFDDPAVRVHAIPITPAKRLLAMLRYPHLPQFAAVRRMCAQQTVNRLLSEVPYTTFYADFAQGLAALPVSVWTATVFRQHDVVSKLYRRQQSMSGMRGLFYRLEHYRARRWETLAWSRVAKIITLSIDDPAEIIEHAPTACVEVQPPQATIEIGSVRDPAKINPGEVVLWGNFSRAENQDAALWALQDIMPKVWAVMPEAHLVILGAHPPGHILTHAGPKVTVTGFVENPAEHFARADVALAPLRFGSGVKLKVLETSQAGLTTITTPVGAEGLNPSDRIVVADTADDLAQSLLAALSPSQAPRYDAVPVST